MKPNQNSLTIEDRWKFYLALGLYTAYGKLKSTRQEELAKERRFSSWAEVVELATGDEDEDDAPKQKS